MALPTPEQKDLILKMCKSHVFNIERPLILEMVNVWDKLEATRIIDWLLYQSKKRKYEELIQDLRELVKINKHYLLIISPEYPEKVLEYCSFRKIPYKELKRLKKQIEDYIKEVTQTEL